MSIITLPAPRSQRCQGPGPCLGRLEETSALSSTTRSSSPCPTGSHCWRCFRGGLAPFGWSPGLGHSTQLVGTFSSTNASSGETLSVQAAEAKLACPSIGESRSLTERKKLHCWSLSKAPRALWMFPTPTLRPCFQGSAIFVNLALANEQGSTAVIWLEDNRWP